MRMCMLGWLELRTAVGHAKDEMLFNDTGEEETLEDILLSDRQVEPQRTC